MPILRVRVRVRPGSSRTAVRGRYGNEGSTLTVAVHAPPVDGAANEAVIKAVASAFEIRPARVTLVSGHQGRTKVLELEVESLTAAEDKLRELLDA